MIKYKEIFKLKSMLEEVKIPFEFTDETVDMGDDFPRLEKYHIEYPCTYKQNQDRVCSVVQGYGTYGNEQNLLEIMGLLTPDEEKNDIVAGWLTATDVFIRIKQHYEAQNGVVILYENSCN